MSVAVWPSELPKPTREGYQSQLDDPRLAKSRSTGPIGYRTGWSSTTEGVALSVLLSRSQKGDFDKFFREDCEVGALPFWMPDPVSDGWPLLAADGSPLLLEDGTPLLMAAQWLCLWGKEMPIERVVGVEFAISFTVVVMP